MRMIAKWVGAATVSAGALTCVGVGAAAAADVPVPYSQPPQQGYVYREAPPTYVYPAPAPVYRYYEPPVVAVVPPPLYYYGRPYYYARGYGPHWRHWGHRHW